MSRRKGSDNFGFRQFSANTGIRSVPDISGSEKPSELSRPQPFNRRFRPATGTKDFSVLSDYNYASLWIRWRRGYELSMYAQQAFDGLGYGFKYYLGNDPGSGVYVPGLSFLYPTTRTDSKMWMVGIRPRDSFNFKDYGYAVDSVTNYDPQTYAVKLTSTFGAPVSFFKGEVLSNRFTAGGVDKLFGFNNYTVVAVGFNGVPKDPDFTPTFNTLFLSHSPENSWSVVNANTMTVPASGPPAPGEFLTTEMRSQCSCPDFLGRESFDLYQKSLKMRYPYTGVFNTAPGFYDAGPEQSPRVVSAQDNPGYARSFGFIYLNQIYNIPSYEQESYSDPNLFYYQPKWCKHIYAAMWDLKNKYQQSSATTIWLPQPNDEPMNEWYREKFELDLQKQNSFYNRERNLTWWSRYGPSIEEMPKQMLYRDTCNVVAKILNVGDLGSTAPLNPANIVLEPVSVYDPYAPQAIETYDGGTYRNGAPVLTPVNIIDGGTYANGTEIPPIGISLNGGTYS